MDCTSCKEKQKQAEPIPFIAYESGLARMERSNHRSWVLSIILVVLLIVSWAGFIWYESQFELVTETVTTQDVWQETTRGGNQFIGGDLNEYTESQNNDSD